MGVRAEKAKAEIESLIMERVKRDPTCRNVLGVVVTLLERRALHHPNWRASFIVDGHGKTPPFAFQVADELASEFDLAL
jgi:hypothetical protein